MNQIDRLIISKMNDINEVLDIFTYIWMSDLIICTPKAAWGCQQAGNRKRSHTQYPSMAWGEQ